MQALVTGGNGFLGRYLVERLVARGDRVRALCRRPVPALDALGVDVVLGDLRDPQAVSAACAGIEAAFHVAGVAGIWGPWEHYYSSNVLGTRHVIGGCIAHGVPRLIYTSSPSVVFDGRYQCGVDESVPYPRRWLCHYPHTKALAEQEALAAHGTGSLMTCALRPHLIWGPRDQHLIPRLIARARAGKLRRVGDGTNLIDTVYVENAASAHLQAADALVPGSPVGGKAYFITQGDPVNCWGWINRLLQVARLPPVTRSISATAAWRIGAILETVHRLAGIKAEPRMTRFLAAQLSRSHYYSIRRAERDFGYRPEITIDEGIRRLAAAI